VTFSRDRQRAGKKSRRTKKYPRGHFRLASRRLNYMQQE
jgi:hypothetical protein